MFGGGANNSTSNSTSNEATENVSKYNKVKQINTNVQCGGEDNTNESYTENSVYQENTNKQTGNPNINIQKNENKQFIAEHNSAGGLNSLFSQNTLVPSTSNTVMDNTPANPVEINPLFNPLENSFNNIKYLSQDIQPYNYNSSNVSTNNIIEEINKEHEEMIYFISELDNEIKESLTNSNVITSKFKNYTNLISEATASHQETLNKIEILKNKLSNNPFYYEYSKDITPLNSSLNVNSQNTNTNYDNLDDLFYKNKSDENVKINDNNYETSSYNSSNQSVENFIADTTPIIMIENTETNNINLNSPAKASSDILPLESNPELTGESRFSSESSLKSDPIKKESTTFSLKKKISSFFKNITISKSKSMTDLHDEALPNSYNYPNNKRSFPFIKK